MHLTDMTEDQMREAAIELCRIEGLDPHQRVFPLWDKLGMGQLCEQWENQRMHVRHWVHVMQAVNRVARSYNQ